MLHASCGDEGQQLSPKRFGSKNKSVKDLVVDDEIGGRTYVQTNKGTDDEKDHAEVPGADVEGGDHDSTADQSKKDWNDDVITVFQSPTRRPRDAHHQNESDDRRRRLDEVGSGTRKSEGSNNLCIVVSDGML